MLAPDTARTSMLELASAHLFNSWLNSILTLAAAGGDRLARCRKPSYWAIFDAVFSHDPTACRAAKGACWGFIVEKFRLIMFGTYPYAEHWRPTLTIAMLLTLIGLTMNLNAVGPRAVARLADRRAAIGC